MSYIQFRQSGESPSGKTKIWTVVSSTGAILGHVRWWPVWRAYVFEPAISTVWDVACLNDVAEFVSFENQKHRETRNILEKSL